MRFKIVFWLFILTITSGSGQNSKEIYLKGVNFYKSESYDSARTSFSNLIESGEKSDSLFNYMGQSLYHLNDTILAFSYFYKAKSLNQKNRMVLFNLGTSYYDKLNFDSALFYFNKAISLDSKDFDSYNNRGLLYYDISQYEKSRDDFLQILSNGAISSRVYYNLARTEQKLLNNKLAIKYYKKAIELDPQDYNAFMNLGNCYADLKKYPKAISAYNSSEKLNNKNFLLYQNRGHTYCDMLQFEMALKDYSVMLQESVVNNEVYMWIGETKLRLNDKSGCNDLIKAYHLGVKDAIQIYDSNCVQ